ncbi:MAG: 50S ribosomal protein L11 methyltransferase [Ignavibacteriaceae bacterium]|jgi:Ribosomal protein L11 methylase|nr:MAG: 50S ribosomal protein L11 methyltransferase [Chlorobi bacterium OLB4]MBW7854852.1 50S ribosomal protein L11 methyltransferase [Ignavibacteria bacterium]MEB2329324.1 50S ribosomal protein L11 methyltransferase [Ignavibacteriaceae bacterium]OQY78433.1 MAG: ribosomal protein L11 methyltransferase [Ignavibacteriales bacterium UTCHB1]
MNYFEVRVKFNRKNREQIESLLFLNGVTNILEEGSEFITYFESSAGWKTEELKSNLLSVLSLSPDDFIVAELEEKNWNQEWEKTIEPVHISDKIIVYPSWKSDEVKTEPGKVLIEINPKMSFGTGHNETTQLMLEMIAKNITGTEKKMLDYGCGTAVLSIACAKLGVSEAIAIDNDPDAIENANEYVTVNNVAEIVQVRFSNIQSLDESGFDIICANIIRSVIVDTFDLIHAKLNSGGKLLLSGILHQEWGPIVSLLMKNYYSPVVINSKAEWLGIYARKK